MTEARNRRGSGAYDRFVEHWTELRLESPYRLMARFDEASKQLITVAGALEGIYIAAYAFGDTLKDAPAVIGGVLMIPLVFVIFFAARCVCVVPPGAEAMAAFKVVRHGAEAGWDGKWLAESMDNWCQQVDAVAEKKRLYLHFANWSFVIAAASAVAALVALMVES